MAYSHKMWVLNTHICECQLYRGRDKFVGKVRKMSPATMKKENLRLRLLFIKMMDNEEKTGRKPVLYSWRIIDQDDLKRAIG